MTTKTDITLLPCPFCDCAMSLSAVARDWWCVDGDHHDDCILHAQRYDAPQTDEQKQLLIEAWNRRAAVEADRQGRMPSDEELLKWAGEEQFFLFCDEDEFLQIAREVLSRYGSGQPKPSNSTELKQPAASAEPAVWVAADTLYSAHPTCISSLAYMSQIDHDRGREYVPLAIINHHAAPVAQEPVQSDSFRACAIGDSNYAAGMLLGWNLCIDGNEEQFNQTREARLRAAAQASRAAKSQEAAPVAAQAQQPVNGDDEFPAVKAFEGETHVAVPIGILAACKYAIEKKKDAPNLLAELRRYAIGDLSVPVVAPSTQDWEDAERYRWLRNESWAGYNTGPSKPRVAETVVITQDGAGNVKTILAEDALDTAIDAARAVKDRT